MSAAAAAPATPLPGSTTPAGTPHVDLTQLDLADDVVFVTDAHGTIVDVNAAFVRVTGYSRQEAIGSTPRLLSSGYQDDAFYADLWRTITSGQSWQGQLIDRRRDGALRTHHVTITPVTGHDGRITHFLAIERDITGELRRQLAMGTTGLVHTDADGRCVYASDRAAELLDGTPGMLLGHGVVSALVPEDADAFREVVTLAIDGGRDYRLDVRTNGGRWLSVVVAPLRLGTADVVGATCAIEDAEEAAAARATRRRQDGLVSSILDALPEAVAVLDGDGEVVAANTAWRSAQGAADRWPAGAADVGDDLLGMTRNAALSGDDRARILDATLRSALRRGGGSHPVPGVSITPLAWDEGGVVLRIGP